METREYIRIVESGDTAVLMIHGIVGTPAHFKDFMPLIPDDWSICNLLLDGHGKGVREFGASSMARWKMQVSNRLQELLVSHQRVLIVAHSMGTLFALRAAVEYPGQIAGLFLLNVPMRVHLPPRTIAAALKNALGLVRPSDKTAMAMKAGCGVELSPWLWKYLSWIPRYVELLREIGHTRRLLPRLSVPAQVFQSQKDELVSNRALKDLQGYRHIVVSELPQSGHFGYERRDLRRIQSELEKQIAKIQREE